MIDQITFKNASAVENSDLELLTQFACRLAEHAGAEILPYFRQPVAVRNKLAETNDFDPVTIADQAAETVMRQLIKKHYPQHGILGEEHGYEAGESALTWVLDPIDGTRAFITGLPVWGTLIALFDGTKPVIGVMDQPFTGERYIGNRNQSLCLHQNIEVLLQTRQCNNLADAIMMTTSPDMFRNENEVMVYEQLQSKLLMSRYGGDCYAYCMLARGYVDLVVEADLQPYDIQALIPIVEGAGGVVSSWDGSSAYSGGQVIAAGSESVYQQALEILHTAAA